MLMVLHLKLRIESVYLNLGKNGFLLRGQLASVSLPQMCVLQLEGQGITYNVFVQIVAAGPTTKKGALLTVPLLDCVSKLSKEIL